MEVPPFVTFHFINAYEETDEEGRVTAIIADCCEHNANTAILDKLRLHNLRSSSGQDVLPDARYVHTRATRRRPAVNLLRYACTYARWMTGNTMCRVGRFRIPLDGSQFGELETALDPEEHGRGMDMCSINPAHVGREYRYAYACGARRPCNFPNTLTKVDLVERTAKNWHEEGSVPSEPFFVPRPGATEEDDG